MLTYSDTERETEVAVYPTRSEAILREIIKPIEAGGASADEYDIEAIADATLMWDSTHCGYCSMLTPSEFWLTVERYAL